MQGLFDGAHRQPFDEIALHDEGEDDHRQRNHEGAGADRVPLDPLRRAEAEQCNRRGGRFSARQDEGEQELVPGANEHENRRREYAAACQRRRRPGSEPAIRLRRRYVPRRPGSLACP